MVAKKSLRERILAVRREAISLQIEALDQLAEAELDALKRLPAEYPSQAFARVARSMKRTLQSIAQSRAWLEFSRDRLEEI